MILTCDKCKLATTCPKKGSSPFSHQGQKQLKCELIGNFGKDPVDVSILSLASRARMEKDGPCTSYVDIPMYDASSDKVTFETTIIFHHPIRHPRDLAVSELDIMNLPYRRSHKI
jgi:hypothetical protein